MSNEFEQKNVLVVGLARSGIAAVKLLHRLGAHVIANDSKTEDQFAGALDPIKGLCDMRLGCPASDLIGSVQVMVISPGISKNAAFVTKAKALGVEVIGEVELGYRLTKGRIAAITGTNGKTTTTTLVGEIFKAAGYDTHVVGNIGNPITENCDKTTDDSVTVVEISSFQCESMVRFCPQVGVVLNIKEDHLNRHGDMNTYVAEKRRMLEAQGAGDVAILNFEDPVCCEMAEGLACDVIYFSSKSALEKGVFVRDGWVIVRLGEEESKIIRVNDIYIPGPHNLENALAATLIASQMRIEPVIIAQVLRTFKGVEHRLETVRMLHGVTWINDSKGTNVDSTQKAIETMTDMTVLILGGSEKHVDFAPLAQSVVQSGQMRAVVLIGETASGIDRALRAAGYTSVHHAGNDFDKCLSLCASLAREGDNVLLSPACASFGMFNDYEHRGAEFKRIVRAMI